MPMQVLNGYTIDETQWQTLGGNGDCNKTGVKDGKKYFIKRMMDPKYPSDDFTGDFRAKMIRTCDEWLARRRKVAAKLPGTGSGNLVKPLEYFRNGLSFYEVTYLIEIDAISYKDVWKRRTDEKRLMMQTISMIMSEMHENGVIHGDLDPGDSHNPGNILFSHAFNGNLITKLIDFTDAFLENDPPDSIMSKEPWWSPEVALYDQRGAEVRELISSKIDVFSLGVIFHQYCAKDGAFPPCSRDYPWQEFFHGRNEIRLDSGIPEEFRDVIARMLQKDPDARPTMQEVHHRLLHGRWLSAKRLSSPKRDTSPGIEIPTGTGKTPDGRNVKNAWKLPSGKVTIEFSDGEKVTMESFFAESFKYIK